MRPYIILLFAVVTFSASALQIGDFYKSAEVMKANSVKLVNDSLIKVSATIKGYGANSPYAIRTVDVPKASFLSHVKTNLGGLVKKNAWYAAWFSTMAAAGWAIDELTNQMTQTTVANLGSCSVYTPNSVFLNVSLKKCADLAWDAKALPYQRLNIEYQEWSPGRFTIKQHYQTKDSPPIPLYYELSWTWDWEVEPETEVDQITDQQLWDSLTSFMLEDPKAAAQAFMVPDAWPYPYPHIFPDPVKYIPGVTEADEALLDSLIKGQLQTTNPSAPNYVTPEKLQQLQQLLSQLQQGITPEGGLGDLNDALKSPLTQAQLEETLNKEKEAEAKADQEAATNAKQALDPVEANIDALSEEKKWFEDAIKDSVNQAPPSSGLSLPKWTWPVGSCKPFPVVFTISGLTAKANDGGAFCDNYNDVYHPLIYWFLYMLLALYLFVLWNRTMVQVLGSR